MTKLIEGVPETITRAQLCEMLEIIGIDPKTTFSVHMDVDGILAKVFALDAAGKKQVGMDSMLTHTIHIKIVDEPTE